MFWSNCILNQKFQIEKKNTFVLIKTNCSLGISCWNPVGKKLLWKFDFGRNINKFEFILLPQI